MKNIKWKYILTPACAVIIIVGLVIGVNKTKIPHIIIRKANITEDLKEEKENLQVQLNINKIDSMALAKLDADIKVLDNVKLDFEFLDNIKVPSDLNNINRCALYIKGPNSKEYTILNNYEFVYRSEQQDRDIVIAFSTEHKPLRDYYIDDVNSKSKIGNVELEISQYKEMYIVTFNYKNINFDIETNNIKREELIEFLKSIIIGLQNYNVKLEEKDVGEYN